jgi:hypothetical protein
MTRAEHQEGQTKPAQDCESLRISPVLVRDCSRPEQPIHTEEVDLLELQDVCSHYGVPAMCEHSDSASLVK